MVSILLAQLVSAQVQVVVLRGPDAMLAPVRAELCKAGTACVDGTRVYAEVLGPSVGDFNGFRAKPGAAWPAALAPVWAEALQRCDALTAPVAQHTLEAEKCAHAVAGYLWGRWLDEVKATRVVVVEVSNGRTTRVDALGYAWPATTGASGWDQFDADELPRLPARALELAKAARALEGNRATLELPRELPPLPTALGVSPLAGRAENKTPVPGLVACPRAPAALEVEGTQPLSTSLVARWAASPHGEAPALRCTLSEQLQDFIVMMGEKMPARIATARLTCGEVTVSAECSLTLVRGEPVEVLSSRLLTSLAERLCR